LGEEPLEAELGRLDLEQEFGPLVLIQRRVVEELKTDLISAAIDKESVASVILVNDCCGGVSEKQISSEECEDQGFHFW